jgi:hypothetical protein
MVCHLLFVRYPRDIGSIVILSRESEWASSGGVRKPRRCRHFRFRVSNSLRLPNLVNCFIFSPANWSMWGCIYAVPDLSLTLLRKTRN